MLSGFLGLLGLVQTLQCAPWQPPDGCRLCRRTPGKGSSRSTMTLRGKELPTALPMSAHAALACEGSPIMTGSSEALDFCARSSTAHVALQGHIPQLPTTCHDAPLLAVAPRRVEDLLQAVAGLSDPQLSGCILLHGGSGEALSSLPHGDALPTDGCVYAFLATEMQQGPEDVQPPGQPVISAPAPEQWSVGGTQQYPLPSLGAALQAARDTAHGPAAGEVMPAAVSSVATAVATLQLAQRTVAHAYATLHAADHIAMASKAAGSNLQSLFQGAAGEVAGITKAVQALQPNEERLRSRFHIYLDRLTKLSLHEALADLNGVDASNSTLASVLDVPGIQEEAADTWATGDAVRTATAELAADEQLAATAVQGVLDLPLVLPTTSEAAKAHVTALQPLERDLHSQAAEVEEKWEAVVAPAIAALGGTSLDAVSPALEAVERLRLTTDMDIIPASRALLSNAADLLKAAVQCKHAIRKQQAVILAAVGQRSVQVSQLMATCRAVDAQVAEWRRGLRNVASVRALPTAYKAAVHEVARRRAHGRLLKARVESMVSVLKASSLREAGRRRRFETRHGSALPLGLFPGMDAEAPEVRLSVEVFDQALPAIDNVPASLATSGAVSATQVSPWLAGAPAPSAASSGGAPPPLSLGTSSMSTLSLGELEGSSSRAAQRTASGGSSGEADASAREHGTEHVMHSLARSMVASSSGDVAVAGDGRAVGRVGRTISEPQSGKLPGTGESSTLEANTSLMLRLREVEAENAALRARLASREAVSASAGLADLAGGDTPTVGDSPGHAPRKGSFLSSEQSSEDGTYLSMVQGSMQTALAQSNAAGVLEAFRQSVEATLSEADVEDVAKVRQQLLDQLAVPCETMGGGQPQWPPAGEVVLRTTSQLTRLVSYAVRACRNLDGLLSSSVAFSGFMPGRNALFLRVPWPLKQLQDGGAHGLLQWHYVAFNIGAPHHYANSSSLPESVKSDLPDYVVLAISEVQAFTASAAFNPHGVSVGSQFFSVHGAVVATGVPLREGSTGGGSTGSPDTPTPGRLTQWGEGPSGSPRAHPPPGEHSKH